MRAQAYAPEAQNKWEAMLLGYQRMPFAELLAYTEVALRVPVETLVSRPGLRVACERCGEEILNGRELLQGGVLLCRACAGQAYYRSSETV